jgi:DNA primase
MDRETLTRRIREAVDIVDVIGSYVTLRRAGSGFKGLCPFHEEKTPSFTVHPVRQTFRCFGCGAGGDVFSFLQLKEGVDFPEARRMLADRAGIQLEQARTSQNRGPDKSDLGRANDWAMRVFQQNLTSSAGEQARNYIQDRSISDEMTSQFKLGLALDSFDGLIRKADTSKVDVKLLAAAGLVKERQQGGYYDTFRNRLMFPIHDTWGRVIGFGGRTLGDDPAKYLNTPATALFDKGTHLFGLDQARQAMADNSRAIVVEGYTDCIMAHQFGFCETVATLGTAMTEAHAKTLRRYTDRVILLFDSDEAGQRAADRAAAVSVTVGLDVALARVPQGKDPCDYLLSGGKSSFEQVLNTAEGALEFKWQQLCKEYAASESGPGRQRALETYLQQLADWASGGAIDSIKMGMMLNQVSQIVALPPEALYPRLRRSIRSRSGSRHTGPKGDTSERGSSTTRRLNSQQVALQQIMEVLLNESRYFPAVRDVVSPAAYSDAALATIATELWEMLEGEEEFRLDALISRLETPEFGRRIIELQSRGERRGGYDNVISGALACLEAFEQQQEAARLAEMIRASKKNDTSRHDGETEDTENEEDQALRALGDRLKTSHFLNARARRSLLDL